MNCRFRFLITASACALLLSATTGYPVNTYVESFSTTTYKDTTNTTANWDTTAGELRLFPFAASEVGAFDFAGEAQGIVVEGDLAFVAAGTGGFFVIDISDPAGPTQIGSFTSYGGWIYGVQVAGNLAFLTNGNRGLRIVDISNPAAPAHRSTFGSPDALRVAVAGDLAFLVDKSMGLRIIDISNPASPIAVGLVATPDVAWAVAVAGDLAFVADSNSGLQIIDITNPGSAAIIGSYNTPGSARSVSVAGDLAIVADGASGLQIIDISNPASPVLTGTCDTPGFAASVDVEGDLAYVADNTSGLQMIDITDPSNPTLVTSMAPQSAALSVAVAGDLAYVADNTSGLQVVRIAQPESGWNVPEGAYDTPGYANGVAVAGNLAYVADNSWGLQILDITDPTAPTPVGSYDTPDLAHDVAVAGDLAYVADFATLQIIDVTDPTTPTLVGSYNTPGLASEVAVAGDLAFVADGSAGGLLVFDISDPANPSVIGTYDTPGAAEGVAVAGDLAFVADNVSGLQIIDIADPTTPTPVGSYDTPGIAKGVAVMGDLAVVADWDSGGHIIDISDPANPALLGSMQPASPLGTTGRVKAITVAGNFAFVTDVTTSAPDLTVYDISNPASPEEFTFFDRAAGEGVSTVVVDGERAYVAGYSDGLLVYRVFQSEVNIDDNVGQSLTVDNTAATILRARLSSLQQSGGTSTWITGNGGADWQPLGWGSDWTPLLVPGSDLRWRASLYRLAWTSPTITNLQLEWLYDCATIDAVTDVPGDQGGRVYVRLGRSGYDFSDETANPVTQYGIYRRVDGAALQTEVESALGAREDGIEDGIAPLPGVESVWLDGKRYVLGSTAAGTFPPGTWVLVQTVPATQTDSYLGEVTTEADSSALGANYSTFVVTTHTTIPSLWFISEADSGYSVDNLPPGVPQGLAAAYNTGSGNQLSWEPNTEVDFQYYRVYRDTDVNFVPSGANFVEGTIATDWTDPTYDGGGVFYKITAVDYVGNESDPTSPGTTTSVTDDGAPTAFALYQNHPNPFNPTTQITYDVPHGGADVTLRVYDIGGRTVRTLVEGRQTEGRKSVTWNGRNDHGRPVATGIYFYRLTARNFEKTRKMSLLK